MAHQHPPRFLKIVDDAKTRVRETNVDEVKKRMDRGEKFMLVDVREESEFAKDHLPGAIHLGKGIIERDIEARVPDLDTEIVLYCGGGFRSALAADNLQKMGYTNVISMDGGIRDWREKGYPLTKGSEPSSQYSALGRTVRDASRIHRSTSCCRHLRLLMNGRIFFWSLTSALAGFLFGFDTVVISGAEKTIQSLWGLSPGLHGIAMASALYGTVVGSLLGGWPADRFGRKATLLWIGVLYFVGAVGSGLASNVAMFIIARVIGGLGIGISTVVAPMYISEIAPPKYRGRLAGMFQFNIVFGILIAFVSNALLAGIGENAWRWMLGVAAFPSLLYAVFCFGLPESPRWLLSRKGDREAGLQVLQRIEPEASKAEIAAEADSILGCILGAGIVGTFLDEASAQTDPARHSDCLLQPTLRHQCDFVFRAAHL